MVCVESFHLDSHGKTSLTHMPIVNELSETIDLESTLIRAEVLFRRFQRLIEAIDKKHNFPAPRMRTDSSQALSQSSSGSPSRQGSDKALDQTKKTISPELRKLLSRNVEILPRKVVHKHGDGFTAESHSKP
jgi:hypothetical protein